MLSKKDPTTLPAWHKLHDHFNEVKSTHLKDFFKEHPTRTKDFSVEACELYLDYSKNHISSKTFELLIDLANEAGVSDSILAMKGGEPINEREGRSVLHYALRSTQPSLMDGDINLMELIRKELDKVRNISSKIQSGEWTGHSGKRIKNIVNIGIGGSDLGPQLVCNGLKPYWKNVTPYFVSNVDASQWDEIKEKINPEETLFIIASKTFTTDETMTNARTIRSWFIDQMGVDEAVPKHFIAVSTNIEAVQEFGISTENIVGFWDWVGGRFSLWSSIGISVACTVGYQQFEELLAGANSMDEHFFNADFSENLPVILALITIWQVNFSGWNNKAVLPYSHLLRDLPRFIQQLIMESNGKQVGRDGHKVSYSTCPVYFGEAGTNGQHAFYQLLHQGTEVIPADFIAVAKSSPEYPEHQKKLIANCFAQSEALMDGHEDSDPYKSFEGNRPSNTILIKELTPKSFGALLAMYEHQVFVQGIIWNIYSFDQWGVELGKKLAKKIISSSEASSNDSTNSLLDKLKSLDT